jgi:hypothetical protein
MQGDAIPCSVVLFRGQNSENIFHRHSQFQ